MHQKIFPIQPTDNKTEAAPEDPLLLRGRGLIADMDGDPPPVPKLPAHLIDEADQWSLGCGGREP